METIRAELITFREDLGGYIIYVFKNLANGTYEMCTRMPRWESPGLKIGDVGYLKYNIVIAGDDSWYNKNTNTKVSYNYTNVYFVDFIYERPKEADLIL